MFRQCWERSRPSVGQTRSCTSPRQGLPLLLVFKGNPARELVRLLPQCGKVRWRRIYHDSIRLVPVQCLAELRSYNPHGCLSLLFASLRRTQLVYHIPLPRRKRDFGQSGLRHANGGSGRACRGRRREGRRRANGCATVAIPAQRQRARCALSQYGSRCGGRGATTLPLRRGPSGGLVPVLQRDRAVEDGRARRGILRVDHEVPRTLELEPLA